MSTQLVADTIDDITPAWLSGVLSADGRQVTVNEVTAQRIGTGQTGTTYRLSLVHDSPGLFPKRMIVKLGAEDHAKRVAVAFGYQQEYAFYTRVAKAVAIRIPKCHHAAINKDGTSFTLLLEDLAPAVSGIQARACSPQLAELALRNLAGLHAPRWNDPVLVEWRLLDWSSVAADDIRDFQVDATEKLIEWLGDRLAHRDIAVLREAARLAPAFLATRTVPFTVLHGDYRLDNLLFHPDGSEVIAVDWQTMARGPAARDVAYFLGTCLETRVRRKYELALVETYHAALLVRGVTDYGFDDCFHDYRLGQLWGAQITTIGALNAFEERPFGADEMFLAMARRSCAAIRDLGSLSLIA